MNINIKIKNLITLALLISFSSFADGTKNSAPEAPVVEVEALVSATKLAEAVQTLRSLSDLPELEKAFINTAPTDREDTVLVGKLGIDGGNKAMIVKLAEEIADNKHGAFDSLLIAHKGKLLFESYYNNGRVNLPHNQASATKTYTSLVLSRAIQLGYLSMSDLDKPLVSFLKDLQPSKFTEGADKITLHQALTMTTGIRLSDENREKMQKNPEKLKGQESVQGLFEHSDPITEETRVFRYGTGPELVMQVIDAVVPGTAQDFIKNEFLGKLDITNYLWLTAESGLPESGWKVLLTSRDMVKLGTLVINKGKWNGEQLISKAFIAKAINRIVLSSDDENFSDDGIITDTGYGYFLWQADMEYNNKNYFSTSARGGGGQYIIVIEALDIVVVVTANDRDDNTLKVVAERILPAFFEYGFPVLKGPYIEQKPPGLTPEVFAPGIVSTAHHEWGGSFTPDMKEFYFNRKNNKSGESSKVVFKSENNRWHESRVEPGMGGSISPDGKTMLFEHQYRQRTADGWSELKSLGSAFEDIEIMRLTTSSKGTYVFDEFPSDGKGKLRYSRLINGEREAPKLLSKEINSGKGNVHPFIAPDESYILWDSERDCGYGDSDIYISFRQQDGSWGAAINLGDKVNTSASQRGGYVTPDGKYLFFNSPVSPGNGDIFWVDAQIIENLRPQE